MNGFQAIQRRLVLMRDIRPLFVAEAAHKSVELAKYSIAAQKDPYGIPWAETKTGIAFDHGNTYLRMERGVTVTDRVTMIQRNFSTELIPLGRGFYLNSSHFAFGWHQRGESKDGRLPARPMVPTAARGLGTWAGPFHAIISSNWYVLCTRVIT